MLKEIVAQVEQTSVPPEWGVVPGFSTSHLRRFIHLLCRSHEKPFYLEVGTFLGGTFVAAMHNNTGRFISIDNLSEFEDNVRCGEVFLKYTREDQRNFIHQLICSYGRGQASFIEADGTLLPPWVITDQQAVTVYMYDGDHSFDATARGIINFSPIWAQESVLLVDDYKEAEVREGVAESLKWLPFKVVEEVELADEDGWRFGLYAARLKRK